MRRLIISIMLVTASLGTAHAQIWQYSSQWHNPFDIYTGPVLGGVASKMTEYDGKTMFSPYIGGLLHTYFNNHWGMSLEFAYTRQGAHDAWANFMKEEDLQIKNSDGEVIGEKARGPYEYRFDYINTIYKMRYYPVKNFDAFAGLMVGVHFNAKCDLNDESTDIIKELHKRSAHVIGGVGYELDNLQFEAYYGFPLQGLARSTKGKRIMNGAREHLIMVTVGYRIKIY